MKYLKISGLMIFLLFVSSVFAQDLTISNTPGAIGCSSVNTGTLTFTNATGSDIPGLDYEITIPEGLYIQSVSNPAVLTGGRTFDINDLTVPANNNVSITYSYLYCGYNGSAELTIDQDQNNSVQGSVTSSIFSNFTPAGSNGNLVFQPELSLVPLSGNIGQDLARELVLRNTSPSVFSGTLFFSDVYESSIKVKYAVIKFPNGSTLTVQNTANASPFQFALHLPSVQNGTDIVITEHLEILDCSGFNKSNLTIRSGCGTSYETDATRALDVNRVAVDPLLTLGQTTINGVTPGYSREEVLVQKIPAVINPFTNVCFENSSVVRKTHEYLLTGGAATNVQFELAYDDRQYQMRTYIPQTSVWVRIWDEVEQEYVSFDGDDLFTPDLTNTTQASTNGAPHFYFSGSTNIFISDQPCLSGERIIKRIPIIIPRLSPGRK